MHHGTVPVWWLVEPRSMKEATSGGYLELAAEFEVAAVLRECAAAGAHVVPQGGHTGMVGGGTPRDGEVVVSTSRLATIEQLDEAAAQITVGAGVTLASVQSHAREHGLDFGVDHG